MNGPLRNSIRYRFFSAIALVLLTGTIVLSLAIAFNEGVDQKHRLEQKGRGLVQYVAKLCLDPLIMNDTIQLDSIVNEAHYDDEVLYTVIVDKTGEVKTSQFASINYSSPRIVILKESLHKFDNLGPLLEYIRSSEASIVVTAPVITGDELIGNVVVCLSKHNIIRNILSTVTVIIAMNILVAVVLAIILYLISRRIIFSPISLLAGASKQLAKGNLLTRIETSALGEMQELIDTFNQMATDLQQTTVSKDYVNNIIRSMSEALIIIAPDYIISDVNDAALLLLDYSREELIGLSSDTIFDPTLLGQLFSGLTAGQRISRETWCRRHDGRKVPVLLSVSSMLDNSGVSQGIVCTALDISALKEVSHQLQTSNEALQLEVAQRRQAQEQANQLNADLENQKAALVAANRDLESFCYSVSHDLRAPLRHINGFATMILEDYCRDLDEDGRDCLDRICAASKFMGTLIDDLLRFSRVSRAEMKIEDVDLSGIARSIASMIYATEPGRSTRIEIADGLRTRGDGSLLGMVLQNLIDNAWKYSSKNPEAVIQVGKTTIRGEEVFFVRDNGVGFDMAYKKKLFRVFERLHGEEFEGTGIGLATVQRIIERHGGRVWAESDVGKGATFFFSLARQTTS